MHTFVEAFKWLTDGANWSGSEGIPALTWQHVYVSLISLGIASAVAIPVGLYIGHTRRFQFTAVSVANIGRAIPSFGILVIAYVAVLKISPARAFGITPVLAALVLLAIPPILTNTYVGVQQVDADAVEAARGMGMTERQVLGRLEVPLAVPLLMAGLRTAAVTVVATATLWALIGGGTLGRFVVDGFAQQDYAKTVGGAILVASLAILTEVVLAAVERVVSPRSASLAPRLGRSAPDEPGGVAPAQA
jgi:osmoprotectant transport system permease protein